MQKIEKALKKRMDKIDFFNPILLLIWWLPFAVAGYFIFVHVGYFYLMLGDYSYLFGLLGFSIFGIGSGVFYLKYFCADD